MFIFAVVFFFKQKTAYEMRISDWSSDVCSSDLGRAVQSPSGPSSRPALLEGRRGVRPRAPLRAHVVAQARTYPRTAVDGIARAQRASRSRLSAVAHLPDRRHRGRPHRRLHEDSPFSRRWCRRSEEHTSELQSLMRISYAVFCLK